MVRSMSYNILSDKLVGCYNIDINMKKKETGSSPFDQDCTQHTSIHHSVKAAAFREWPPECVDVS